MKKYIALILALTMVFCFCTEAVAANPAEASAEEKAALTATLTVAQHRTDLEAEFKALIDAFNEEYPNVTVNIETVADYQNTMAVRIAGGEIPDVLEIRDIMIQPDKWADFFAPLTDCGLPEGMLFQDYYTYDGNVYGACEAAGLRMFMYNKTLWAQAGIEAIPTTWDEFMACMEKLSALEGVIPMTSQYNTAWTQREWVDYMAVAMHEAGWKDTWIDMDDPFSDEMIRSCCDQYKAIIDAGYCETDLMSSDWDLQSADFAAGTIGESRVSADFTGINNIAAINIGNFVQEYVIAADPQTVVDAYNARWAAARAEYFGK